MDESRGGSRIVYPKLFATLTEAYLARQFRLAPEERAWAGTAADRAASDSEGRSCRWAVRFRLRRPYRLRVFQISNGRNHRHLPRWLLRGECDLACVRWQSPARPG
jgi:hypothetical protein